MKIGEIVQEVRKLNIEDDEKTRILSGFADLFQVIAKTFYDDVSTYQSSIKKNNRLDLVVNEIYQRLVLPVSCKHFITIIRVQVLVGLNQITVNLFLNKINSNITEKLKNENKDEIIGIIKDLIINNRVKGEGIKAYLDINDYNKLLDKIKDLDIFYIYLMYIINLNTIGDIVKDIPNKPQEPKVGKKEGKPSKSKAVYPSSVDTSKSRGIRVKGTGGMQEKSLQSSSSAAGLSSGMPKSKESDTKQVSASENDLTEILRSFQKLYSNIPILKKIIEGGRLGKKHKSEFENIIVGLTKFIGLSHSKQAELKQDLHSKINRNISKLDEELEKQRRLHESISRAIHNSHNIIKYQNYIIKDLLKLIEKTQELNKYKSHVDLSSIDINTLRTILTASEIKSRERESKETTSQKQSEADIDKTINQILESEIINDKTVEKVAKQVSKLNKVSKRPQKIIKLDDALDDLAVLTASEIDPDKPIKEPIKDILKKFPKSIAELIKNVRKGVSKPIDILIQKLGGRTLRRITGLGHIQDNVSLKAIADKVYRLLTPSLPIPKYLSRAIQSLKNLKYYNLAKRSAKVVSNKIQSENQVKVYKNIEKAIDKNKEFYSKNYLGRRILFGIVSAISSIYRNSAEKSSLINKILETLFGVRPIKITAVLRHKRLNKVKKTKSTEEKLDDTKPFSSAKISSETTLEEGDNIEDSEKSSKQKSGKAISSKQDKIDKKKTDENKNKERNKGEKTNTASGLTFSSKRVAYRQVAPDLVGYMEIKLPRKKEVQEEVEKREDLIDNDFMREYILNEIEMNEALARMLSDGASDKSSSDFGGESMSTSPGSALNNIANTPDQADTVTNQSGSMIARLSNKFSSKLRSFKDKLSKGVSKVMNPVRSIGGKFAKAFKVAGSRLAGIASNVLSKLIRGVPLIGWLTTLTDVIRMAWNVAVAVKAMSPKVRLGYDKLIKNKEEELYKSINQVYSQTLSTGGTQRIVENIRGEGKARESIGEYALIRDKKSAPISSGAVTKPKDIKLGGAEGIGKENAPKPIERYDYQRMETGFYSSDQQYKELLESNIETQRQTIALINQLNSAVAYTDTKATTNAMRQTAAEEQKSSTKIVSGNRVYGFRTP